MFHLMNDDGLHHSNVQGWFRWKNIVYSKKKRS